MLRWARHSVACVQGQGKALHTSSSLHSRRVQAVRKPRGIPEWRSREKELRASLTELETKLDYIDKRDRAEVATKDLPKLDEDALEEIYKGINEGDPIPQHELRLLESEDQRRKMRYANALERTRQELPLLDKEKKGAIAATRPLSFPQRVLSRLDTLSARLVEAEQRIQDKSSAPSSSQVSQLIDELKVSAVEIGNEAKLLEEDKEVLESQEPEDHQHFETVSLDTALGQHKAPEASSLEPAAPPSQAHEVVNGLLRLIEASNNESAHHGLVLSEIRPEEWAALGIQLVGEHQEAILGQAFSLLDKLAKEGKVNQRSLVAFHESVANSLADQGASSHAESVLSRMESMGLPATSFAHHALAKAYIRDPGRGTSAALKLIDHLEVASMPASEATYSLVLSSMLDHPSTEVHDQVWGLWYRMRLNAHPDPDAISWSKMLRACAMGSTPSRDVEFAFLESDRGTRRAGPQNSPALPSRSRQAEAEVALDLFREMTVVQGIRPTPACYDNLIIALCRGPHGRYLEGFKFLQEMITMAQESKFPGYEPTRTTFNALLEGCRRHGDLLRARWVLAEMIRSSAPAWNGSTSELSWDERIKLESRMPDAESFGKLFLTYAAWKPAPVSIMPKNLQSPPQRASTHTASDSPSDAEKQQLKEETAMTGAADTSKSRSLTQPDLDEAAAEFSATPPSTSAEAVREMRGLLARIIADQANGQIHSQASGPFSRVELSPHLLNSYLAALMAHWPKGSKVEALDSALRVEDSLFAKLGVQPNGRSWLQVMRTCFAETPRLRQPNLAAGPKSASSLAAWAWQKWRELEHESDLRADGRRDRDTGTDRRTREQIWGERIRLLAKEGKLDAAMEALREFVTLYPPMPTPNGSFSAEVARSRKMPFFDGEASVRLLAAIEATGQTTALPPPDTSHVNSVSASTHSNDTQADTTSTLPLTDERPSANGLLPSKIAKSGYDWLDAQGNRSSRPPSLSFYELNLLHQRLVEAGDRKSDIAFVGWLCRTWESVESKKLASRRQRQQEQRAAGASSQDVFHSSADNGNAISRNDLQSS